MDGANIADYLATLSRVLEAEDDPAALLRRIVHAAVREIFGAECAGITVVGRDGASTPACTSELVTRVDALQYETGEGPCLDALTDDAVVRADELAGDARWPRFAPAAVAQGVGSMLSFPLFVQVGSVGSLNLYATEAFAFPADAERMGAPLAAHAAVAMAATRKRAELKVALDSRDMIGQAKGILMERYKIGPQRAFELLIAASQQRNVKLRDIAEHLTRTGEFDQPGGTGRRA